MTEATKKYNGFFRQLLFIAVLITIGVVIFTQLKFWVGAFLGAFTIYMVFRTLNFKLTERHRWPGWIASLFLVSLTSLILGGFGFALFKVVANEIGNLDAQGLMSSLSGLTDKINDLIGYKVVPEDILQKSEGIIKTVGTGILNTTYSFTANVVMMLFIVYFMFTGGRRMEARLIQFAPFRDESLCLLKRETKNMVYSNAVLMPLILIAQTIVSVFIYWILGMDGAFFWGFLTAIAGLIPLLGTMIVYIPISIYMIATGEVLHGVILFLYGATIISNTDNVFRILFLRKVADTHPLIVIMGVILGIPLFGFWGIIFGPLLLSGFVLLIKIYYVEYGLIDPEKAGMNCETPVKKQVPRHLKKFAARADRYEETRRTRRMPSQAPDDRVK